MGDAAVYYAQSSVNVLESAEDIGGHTVYLLITSAQPGSTADVLGPIGKDIFAAAEKQSK
ncbi:MAG TPA: hypothetical protein VHU91_01375 [Mycobacteriales bacterium]|nr:hypothetical protein [Mycobacteriales bacterium]